MSSMPKRAANSSIRRARRYLVLANSELPDSRVKNDLRRMAIVQVVAAIDSYMHALVLKKLDDVRVADQLPNKLARLTVGFEDLADLADAWNDHQQDQRARHANGEALKQKRPWAMVKKVLQGRILRDTYQSYEQVATALSMAGIRKGWNDINQELNQPNDGDTKAWLDSLVYRRNKIVHEGDIVRQTRPRRLKLNSIKHDDVLNHVVRMKNLIRAIDRVVNRSS